MTFKKIISILTVISILVAFVPYNRVLAEDVTVLNTIGDVLYSYNSDDLLSYDNYNDYYDLVDNGLKYCVPINQHYVNNTNTSYLPSNLWNLVKNAYNDSSFKNISFHPDTPDGSLKFIIFFVGPSYSNLMELVSIDAQGDIYIVDGHLISDQPYTIYWVDYSFNINTTNEQYVINTNPYNFGGDYKHSSTNNTISSNGVYETNYNNPSYFLYSEIPFYFTYSSNNDYLDMSYLGQSPYNYQNYINVYNAIGSDDTGFVIDRRTELMRNGGSSDVVTPSQYGFKTGSFHNAVYGSTFDDQKLFVAYELNNASKTIKNDLYLKLDYIFDMDGIFVNNDFDYSAQFSNINGSYDLYSLSDSNYINVSLDSVFDKMNVFYRDNRTLVEQYRNIYNYFNPASDGWVASPSQVNPNDAFGILYKNGLLTVSPVSINYSEQFLNSLSVNYKDIGFGIGINANAISNEGGSLPRINRLDSCYITIIESVYNVVTGEESNVFMYTYNYITKEVQEVGTLENGNEVFNGYTNGSQSSLNNPNSDNMNYNTSSGQYLPNAYGGSSSASVGDIIINSGVGSIPYILVDIPENEWMNKTPNLNTFLTEFKTMLAETHEQSVLNMLPATYNYFPAPVMQYLIYGVGLIVMIGIWRAITRR